MDGARVDRTEDFQNFADQDWTWTKKFHSPLISVTSQCFQLARVANFPTSPSLHSCVTMERKSNVRIACCTLLRMLSEQLWSDV